MALPAELDPGTPDGAQYVLDAVRGELYPPTNPSVLLAAARTLYLEGGMSGKVVSILAWLLNVAASNSPEAFVDDSQRDKAVAFHFDETGRRHPMWPGPGQ